MKNKSKKFSIKIAILALIGTVIIAGFLNAPNTNIQNNADNFFKTPIAQAADSEAVTKAKKDLEKAEQEFKAANCDKPNPNKATCGPIQEKIDAAKAIIKPSAGGPTSAEFQKLMNKSIETLNLISEFMQRLIWPVLLLIGGLLKNDILFGAGMEETMLNIWRNIRNIVNILFVIVLLGIAFYNVMGGGNQDYHIKTILPKFIIALIAVNFSFMMVKVVIDGVSVVTTAFFALPSAVEQNLAGEKKSTDLTSTGDFEKKTCEGLYMKNGTYSPPKEGAMCDATQAIFINDAKTFFKEFDGNNAAIVLAINFGEISEIKKVTLSNNTDAVRGLFLNSLFSVVIYIVYSTAFVALLIILAVRLVTLWVTIVLSPLIVLSLIMPDSLKGSLGGADELGKKFIKSAIAPIPIALMMSIGFIMINAWKQARFPGALGESTAGLEMLTSGLSTLQDLIAAIAMVVVIWMGVFEAANGTYAEGAVNTLKESVQKAGQFVVTAPFKYMPIIPMKDGQGEAVSIGAVTGALSQIPAKMRGKQLKSQERVLDQLGIGATPLEQAIKKESKGDRLAKIAANGGWTEQAQRDLGSKLKVKKVRTEFFGTLPQQTKFDGKDYKNHEELARAMENGQLSAKAVKELSNELETRHGGRAPIGGGDQPSAGTAGAAAAVKSVPMSDTFNDKQKEIIANELKGEGKVLEKNQEAANKLKNSANAAAKVKSGFESDMRDARKTPAQRTEVITEARANLTKHLTEMKGGNPTEEDNKDAKKTADQIINTEIKSHISGYQDRKAGATDVQKEEYDKQIKALQDALDEGSSSAEPPAAK